MEGRVLSVAGSDSGGGAGIQADIKTITALGGYAMTALTSLTAQNTLGVLDVQGVDSFLVEQQMRAVIDDIGIDAIKLGALHSRTTVELVARVLERDARGVPMVLDPVSRSTSGARLLDDAGLLALRDRLLPQCALVTPNLAEASALTGLRVEDEGGMYQAADALLLRGAAAVLVTGGHLDSEHVIDLLRTADGDEHRFESERLTTRATHGTGCTLSAGVAAGLAQGMTLMSAVARAIDFVHQAMRWAVPLGSGAATPLDHGFALRQRLASEPVH